MGYLRRPRARVLASRPSFARARLAIDPRARLARPLAPPPVVVGAVDERARRRLATRDARATPERRAAPNSMTTRRPNDARASTGFFT
jgi:hypothetical protein